jgi:hypothetical protein
MALRGAERVRGVTLRIIDLHGLVENAGTEIREKMLLNGQEVPDGFEIRPGFEPWAYTEHDGRHFVICNEGVGYEVSMDEPWEVPLYSRRKGFVSILPSWTVPLTPGEIAPMAGEEIDLADLIRSFGARLEQNFWIWFRELGGLTLVQAGPQ